MVKVSIVVPIYNVELYLRECLDSLINQTLKEIQIVCVNDGSTDASLRILEEYAERDDRIIIIDKENGGYGMAMNFGIARATGEYIGIVEPDDYVPKEMYDELYSVASRERLDFVKADFYRFTGGGEQELKLSYNKLDETNRYYNRVICPFEEPEVVKLVMNTWSGIYRRDFLARHNILHNETPGASFQDNGFFWQTMIYAKKGMFINKPYYMNRRDNPNSSVKNKEKVYCINSEFEYVRNVFCKKGNEELWERFKGYYNYKRFHNYMFTLFRISDEFKWEYVERISGEFKNALELKELDLGLFSKTNAKDVRCLIENPKNFYRRILIRRKIGEIVGIFRD